MPAHRIVLQELKTCLDKGTGSAAVFFRVTRVTRVILAFQRALAFHRSARIARCARSLAALASRIFRKCPSDPRISTCRRIGRLSRKGFISTNPMLCVVHLEYLGLVRERQNTRISPHRLHFNVPSHWYPLPKGFTSTNPMLS